MLTGFCRTLYKSKNSNGDISCFFLTIVCTLGLAPLVLDPKVTGNGLAVTEDVCT